jgi:hypothetical protein
MITKTEFKNFLKKHKIDCEVDNFIDIKYFYPKVQGLDLIYIDFKKPSSEWTSLYYKPFKNLYINTKPDSDGDYETSSYGNIYLPVYSKDILDKFIQSKSNNIDDNIIFKLSDEASIPFNTIEELEQLYSFSMKYLDSYFEMFHTESFLNALSTYRETTKQIKLLTQSKKALMEKTNNVLIKKCNILTDF